MRAFSVLQPRQQVPGGGRRGQNYQAVGHPGGVSSYSWHGLLELCCCKTKARALRALEGHSIYLTKLSLYTSTYIPLLNYTSTELKHALCGNSRDIVYSSTKLNLYTPTYIPLLN